MKSMKLYDRVERIHDELRALGLDGDEPLRVEQLTPFDQYHYFGTEAVDDAITALGIGPGSRVLDIGSGLGGPARYIADRTGARVTALELQADLDVVAKGLTGRCGLTHLVEHRVGDILDGLPGESFDAVISMLCFLHIPRRARLLEICRSCLTDDGAMYLDDYGLRRRPTPAESAALADKVQCPYLPTPDEYAAQLAQAGFGQVSMSDVTEAWTAFTGARLAAFRDARASKVALLGAETVDGLDDFFATVNGLFRAGVITGLKILASP